MSRSSTTRNASHAGSWYTDDGPKLDKQLSDWLKSTATGEGALQEAPVKGCKAIIAPHAGYSYSGPAAAYAYDSVEVKNISRVFILGPSHHYYLDGCALSRCVQYATPIGNLPLDRDTIAELEATGKFELMDKGMDEDEHSIEMHLPYVRKIFEGRDTKIVPILVGSISTSKERSFGALLAPYLADPSTLFIISSDFCHWGSRFRYTHYQPPHSSDLGEGKSLTPSSVGSVVPDGDIWKGIEKLDKLGMDTIAFSVSPASDAGGGTNTDRTPSIAHQDFAAYLKATKNSICGRHPIGVLLGALSTLEKDEEWRKSGMRCEWVRYEQSSPVRSLRDSSVSYASAFVAQGV